LLSNLVRTITVYFVFFHRLGYLGLVGV